MIIDPESVSTGALHSYMLAAVAPRPIAFASTVDASGRVNLSPFSFFNVFSSNPPVMIFSPARRGRDNTTKHTFENLKTVPETVINVVNYAIVEQMSLSSTEYAEGVNEFVKAGLTEIPSDRVKPPRVGEAPVAFECSVNEIIELGSEGGAGNLVICEVKRVHINDAYLDDAGHLDSGRLDLVGRMGGSWYCRASGDALFEIPKPLKTKGIGVDQLPHSIRESTILTGNNLGRLGNVEVLPDDTDLEASRDLGAVQSLLKLKGTTEERMIAFHKLAQQMLENGETRMALATLMVAEHLEP